MIWIILFLVILIISAILAFRSMRNFQEIPLTNLPHGLFVIKNGHLLTASVLEKLHEFSINNGGIISLERLMKGHESVVAIYAPSSLKVHFGELDLLEIEDYLKNHESETDETNPNIVKVNDVLAWLVNPEDADKIAVHPHFLRDLALEDHQHFFWQMVLRPESSKKGFFQTTIRAMVTDPTPATRVELSKKIEGYIKEKTGLIKQEREQNTAQIYEGFVKRTIVPREVKKFQLENSKILKLIGVLA